MSKIICLDPGHGGSDPGAVTNGLKEKTLVLDIAKRVKAYLEKYYSGHKVIMIRSTDTYPSLWDRTNFANRHGADCFVSIHINAGGGTGFESYVVSGAAPNSAGKLQRLIHEEMAPVLKKHGLRDRGKKNDTQGAHNRIHVLRATKMKACLTENLFIDTEKDAKLLKSSSFLQDVAEAHAVAIARCEGLKQKASEPKSGPKPSPKPSQPEGTFYRVVAGSFKDRDGAGERQAKLKKAGFESFIDVVKH